MTAAHAWLALTAVLAGLGAHMLVFDLLGNLVIASAGALLMWPTTAHPNPADLPLIWALVDMTKDDPLAPFAMQPLKCYHFNADGTAAIAYRTRLGYAVVSGDPIGDETRFAELVADFAAMCHTRGWRLVVLGCSQRRLDLWADATVLGQSLRAVPIGRDVVIDVATFDMVGRKYRNLRQAVQRTQNFGVTTEVVSEQGLDDRRLAELAEVLLGSPQRSAHRARVLDVPRRRSRGSVSRGAVDRRPRQTRAGAGLSPVRDRRAWQRGVTRRAVAAPGRAQRYRRAAVGRHDRVGPRQRGAAAVVGVRGVPGDLQRQEPGQDLQPGLHGDPPGRRADCARIAIPLPAQIPRAG